METTDITVYIDNKPYRFHIDVDYENEKTTYRVSTDPEQGEKLDFMPASLHFNEDGKVTIKERLRTVEQEQIARLIWQEILDKMKPWNDLWLVCYSYLFPFSAIKKRDANIVSKFANHFEFFSRWYYNLTSLYSRSPQGGF